jgi:hypothetical protein
MKILTDYAQLEGKTIAFTQMAQFAEQITIATTDNEVLMVTFDIEEEYGERKEIRVLHEGLVYKKIKEDKYLREELSKRGIFDLEKYKEEMEAERISQKKRLEKEKEERELEQLAKLKAKYENK